MPLRELDLLDCTPSTFSQLCDLFVPNALTALQKLRIEEMPDAELENDQNTSRVLSNKDATHISVLQRLGDAVNSLPQLEQVSGDSALFDIAMSQHLSTWCVSYDVHERIWLKVWDRR